MSAPRFSIVIPTRNGSKTLGYTLRTCLMQQFGSFEIVISDNCSSAETRQIVDSLNSDKIRYIRSDFPLAMCDNWEMAVSHATGEYVIVIGDDDGLLPDSLVNLNSFIENTAAKAIRWAVASYTWPDVAAGWVQNKLHVPYPISTVRIDSYQAIQSVINGEKNYAYLPMLYYSAIHRDLISELKYQTGRIFRGGCPDVYSAFAVGYLAKYHYQLGRPLSIVGYSAKSNGVAQFAAKAENPIADEFRVLNEKAGYSLHAQIPDIPAIASVVANEFLQAKEALFPQDGHLILDRRQLVLNCINDLERNNWVEAEVWRALMTAISLSLDDDAELQSWFKRTYMQDYQPQKKEWIFSQDTWLDGVAEDALYLDGKAFGVSDVSGAAEVCGKLLGRAKPLGDVTDQPSGMRHMLDEKEKVIHVQNRELQGKEEVIRVQKRELQEKERVIQGFRASYFYWLLNGPLRGLAYIGPITSRLRTIRSMFMPKLGVLEQHAPRPLLIPQSYAQIPHSFTHRALPSVSIVTPSYNQGEFIERTIRSVLDQGYEDLEYVVQDGNSNDGTLDVLKSFERELTHLESRPDSGQAHAINLGFQHTHGEIMAYLNSDDLLLPGTLKYVAGYFANHPEVDVVYSHRVIINERDQEIGRWVLPRHDNQIILWADYVPQETLFWRRRIWDKAGSHIDESHQFALDWDLILRFRAAGAKFVRLPRFLAAFRMHLRQKTTIYVNQTGAQEMNQLRKRVHGRDIESGELNGNIEPYLRRSVIYHMLYRLGFLRY